jgi:hypothetical protein
VNALVTITCAIFNFAVLAGTAYLVGWRDWSPWWFLLAFLSMASVKVVGKERA